ncbi:amidohydrolase family protein [Nonomuraea sp. NPDC059194]|uniref:amidohydrolase family protein n=1 Tax=Nonomuraea sp. NPDC059194 TaxID=3346764 RepID=UPI0036B82FC6
MADEVDHHVHGATATDLTRAEFENLITESDRPVPAWMSAFDSQLGHAILRHCAPVLGLDPHPDPDYYLQRRAELGVTEVNRRLLRAAGIGRYLVETGYRGAELLDPAGMAAASGSPADEILRLEALAEQVAPGDAAGFADRFATVLFARLPLGPSQPPGLPAPGLAPSVPPPSGALASGAPASGLPAPGLAAPELASSGLPASGLPTPGLPAPGLAAPELATYGPPTSSLPTPGTPDHLTPALQMPDSPGPSGWEARDVRVGGGAVVRGLKTIVAYRYGLDFDPRRPTSREVTRAAGRWLRAVDRGRVRLTDPVVMRHLIWTALDTGLPLQFHVGLGDPDVDLRRADPLLLRDFIELAEPTGVPLLLLHCYPFHRHAGLLAHSYPNVHFDVGLAVNHSGARAKAVVAESLETAPFAKLLFSSDAWGPAELHFLGATLWRRAMASVVDGFVAEGEWSRRQADRVTAMIGGENARRVYRLDEHP